MDEWHGTNTFIHRGDRVFRTFLISNRGDAALGTTWSFLEMRALGRQETWEDSTEGYPQSAPYEWWDWHDECGEHEPSQWFGQQIRTTATIDGRRAAANQAVKRSVINNNRRCRKQEETVAVERPRFSNIRLGKPGKSGLQIPVV